MLGTVRAQEGHASKVHLQAVQSVASPCTESRNRGSPTKLGSCAACLQTMPRMKQMEEVTMCCVGPLAAGVHSSQPRRSSAVYAGAQMSCYLKLVISWKSVKC